LLTEFSIDGAAFAEELLVVVAVVDDDIGDVDDDDDDDVTVGDLGELNTFQILADCASASKLYCYAPKKQETIRDVQGDEGD
jgi:hypothetical protein